MIRVAKIFALVGRQQSLLTYSHSYDILGAGMLWKPKEAQKFIKIR
jgi:hypothetical protein